MAFKTADLLEAYGISAGPDSWLKGVSGGGGAGDYDDVLLDELLALTPPKLGGGRPLRQIRAGVRHASVVVYEDPESSEDEEVDLQEYIAGKSGGDESGLDLKDFVCSAEPAPPAEPGAAV